MNRFFLMAQSTWERLNKPLSRGKISHLTSSCFLNGTQSPIE